MVCREVLNSRAMALILTPDLIRSNTTCFCSSFNTGGRPKRFPAPRALTIPEWVRSSKRSRSNSATAEITCIIIFPVGLVRSMPPNAKQCTLIPVSVSCSTVFLISIALQPRRSSFVTINWSPHFRRASNRLKPGRSLVAAEPLMCSSIICWGLILKPALSISRRWFSVVWSSVDIRQ